MPGGWSVSTENHRDSEMSSLGTLPPFLWYGRKNKPCALLPGLESIPLGVGEDAVSAFLLHTCVLVQNSSLHFSLPNPFPLPLKPLLSRNTALKTTRS